MLRRSLLVVVILLLCSLAFTVAYALLPVRTPADLIYEASQRLARGDAAGCVQLLDQGAKTPAFQQDQALGRQLLKVRLQAHRVLDIPAQALADIEGLIAMEDLDPQLQLDRIYYLGRLGRGDEARLHAIAAVVAQPTRARAHELAGEACKVAYTEDLRTQSQRLRRDLGHEDAQAGIGAFLELLYRPDQDPMLGDAQQRLAALFAKEARLKQGWPASLDEIRKLRGRVQEGLQFFQRALELAGEDPKQRGGYFAAAYNGVAYGLQQADRQDDLLLASEIYLAAYNHRYRTDAAAMMAQSLYADGLYAAVVALCDRFLPMDQIAARIEGKLLTNAVRPLLTAQLLSLYRLDKQRELGDLARTLAPLQAGAPALAALPGLGWGLLAVLQQNHSNAAQSLAWWSDQDLRQQPPQDGPDPLDLVLPLRLSALAATGAAPNAQQAVVDAWIQARPASHDARRARAELMLSLGQHAAAMTAAKAMLSQQATDEVALQLLAQAANGAYKASQQDGDSLLLQCLQRNVDHPDEPPHPVCFLLCAESAIRQDRPQVALACARLAGDRFPWSAWPLRLVARAEEKLGHPDRGVEALQRRLLEEPDAEGVAALAFAISMRHGLPVRWLLPVAIERLPPDVELQRALLRIANEDGAPSALPIARRAAQTAPDDAEIQGLAAVAFARTGTVPQAELALQKAEQAAAVQDSAPARQARLQAAMALHLARAEAGAEDDRALSVRVDQELVATPLHGGDAAKALVTTAAALAERGYDLTASRLLADALRLDDAVAVRDGAAYVLAGRLAQRQGRPEAALSLFTAAMSFDDGHEAAEDLARLELTADRRTRAIAALAMASEPQDPALLLLLGSANAAEVARTRLAADPSDLLAGVAHALAPDAGANCFGAELQQVERTRQQQTLMLTSWLRQPQVAPHLLAAAGELAAALPGSPTVRMLEARALLALGQPSQAAAVHASLFEAGHRSPQLQMEAMLAWALPGYVPPKLLLAELRQIEEREPQSLPALVRARLMLESAKEAAATGQPDIEIELLAQAWTQWPKESGADVQAAERLIQAARIQEALALLQKLRLGATGTDLEQAARLAYRTVRTYADSLPADVVQAAETQALVDATRGYFLGEAMALLLQRQNRLAAVPPARLAELVGKLLQAAATGEAEWADAEAALAHCQTRFGAAATLELAQEALTAHPASLPLWRRRARLLTELGKVEQGLVPLRTLTLVAQDADAALDLVELACQSRRLEGGDLRALTDVPAATLASPHGKDVVGMAALRSGDAQQARSLLAAGAADQPFALLARALAGMAADSPEGRKEARIALTELLRRFPASSAAQNAASFLRQLPDEG